MPTNLDIFLFVLKYALTSFGGLVTVLPAMERDLAALGWLTHADFASTYALVQVLPGPNSVFCLLLGFKIGGAGGLLSAALGVFLPPLLLMGAIWQVAKRGGQHRLFKVLSSGLKFVVLALMLTSTWDYVMLHTLHSPGDRTIRYASLGVAVLACILGFSKRISKTAIIGGGALLWAAFGT